jgi:hypothetical protein
MLLHAPDGAIEHPTHFARPEMPVPSEDDLPLPLVAGAVQEDGVEVGVAA